MLRRVKRWSLMVAGGLAPVLVLAVALPAFIDANDYRSVIASELGRRIGREVTIGGDIALSVVPWLGIELDDVRLANAEGFGPAPLAAVRHLRVRVRLWPLLSRRLVMDTVTVDGLRLGLAVDARGRANWQGLMSREAEGTASPPGRIESSDGTGASPPLALAALTVGGVELVDARLDWRDERNATRLVLAPLSLTSGPVVPGRPVDLSLHTRVDGSGPAVSGDVSMHARVDFDAARRRLVVEDLHVESDADWTASRLKTRGQLDAALAADLERQTLQLTGLRLALRATGPTIPGIRFQAGLKGDLMADLAAGRLHIEDLGIDLAGIRGRLNGVVSGIADTPRFLGRLRIEPFAPRPILERLAVALPEMADDTALKTVALETGVAASTQGIELSKLRLVVDDSTLTGNLTVRHFGRPEIGFALDLDRVDLDRYRPPAAQGRPEAPVTPATAGAATSTALPIDTLRRLAIDGRLGVGRLRVSGVTIGRLHLGLHADRGLIRLDPVAAELYKGHYRGRMSYDVRQLPPRLSVDEHLEGVDIDPLTRDLSGRPLVFGRGDLAIRGRAQGATPDEIVASLGGQARIDLRDGGLHGIALTRLLARSGLVKPDTLKGLAGQDETVYRRLGASFRIDKGVMTTKDLVLDSAQIVARGRGRIDLPARSVDLRIDARTRKQLARMLGDLGGLAIPVHVDGPLAAPSVRIDTEALLKSQLAVQRRRLRQRLEREKKARLDKARRRLEQKARDRLEQQGRRLEERLKRSLKGLF